MTENITSWHKMAYLYLHEEIKLPEIVKFYIFAESIDLIKAEVTSFKVKLGYNVLDNSDLNDALVFGVISHLPEGRKIIYEDLAQILNMTRRIIGLAINRLMENEHLTKEDFGTSGAAYFVNKPLTLPTWIENLTKALVELNADEQLNAAVTEACKDTGFTRGLEILQDELRNKFYRRKK